MDILSKRLKDMREIKGVNQTEVANAIHVSQSAYSGYERGAMPSVEILMELARFFDVSMDYLVGLNTGQQVRRSRSEEQVFSRLARVPQPGCQHPITLEALKRLSDSVVAYVAVGSPVGALPIRTAGNAIFSAAELLEAVAADSLAEVIDAANAMAMAGLSAGDTVKAFAAAREKEE